MIICKHCGYKGYGNENLENVSVWKQENGRQTCRNCGKLRMDKKVLTFGQMHREAVITGDCDDNWYGFRSY